MALGTWMRRNGCNVVNQSQPVNYESISLFTLLKYHVKPLFICDDVCSNFRCGAQHQVSQ